MTNKEECDCISIASGIGALKYGIVFTRANRSSFNLKIEKNISIANKLHELQTNKWKYFTLLLTKRICKL